LGLLAWWKRERTWRQEHIAAFAQVGEVQPDGLTRFQQMCLDAISPYVPTDSFQRVHSKHVGTHLVAPIGSLGVKIFIYDTEAGLWGPKTDRPLEEWDYKLPHDLISALVSECATRAT
jgi:hypothetical protein